MRTIDELIEGFRRFQAAYCGERSEAFERLARAGQSPRFLVISCCDSRVDPAIITDAAPGDLFVVRNVANLVPPYEEGGGYHGTSAALEFAVRKLEVRHVIVLGHAHCGGIRALMGVDGPGAGGAFIGPWMAIAAEARERVRAALSQAGVEERLRACERAVIGVSLRNLMTFPFVREAVNAGRLALHGWYFDIERGALLACGADGRYEVLVEGRPG